MTTFQETLNKALSPKLPMRLLKHDANLVLYMGLWSTWGVNEADHVAAKVVLATALRDPTVPSPPPLVTLDDLTWVVLQLQTVEAENPIWTNMHALLQAEFQTAPDESVEVRRRTQWLRYDPSTKNIQGKQLEQASLLSQVTVTQRATERTAPRPTPTLTRQRVEYQVNEYEGVRVFVEKQTTKQPLQRQLNGDAGLTRDGTLLAAVNEWRTWIVIDGAEPAAA